MKQTNLLAVLPLLFASATYSTAALSKPAYIVLAPNTTATGINTRGFVVGIDYNTEDAFIRGPDGTLTTFDISGLVGVTGINSGNTVIGYYQYNSNNAFAGFIRAFDGTITTFEAPDGGTAEYGQGTYPLSINSAGAIAGYYVDSSEQVHGFVRGTDGAITEFDVPGYVRTEPSSINDDGTIVGSCTDSMSHGFIRSPVGEITTFDVPGATYGTAATSINSKGDITGWYSSSRTGYVGFIRSPSGTLTTIDENVFPTSINVRREVTGTYYEQRDGRRENRIGFTQKYGKRFQPFQVQNEKRITIVEGINDAGTVVGWINTKENKRYTSYGFVRVQ